MESPLVVASDIEDYELTGFISRHLLRSSFSRHLLQSLFPAIYYQAYLAFAID